jgi:hypothetical protein
VEATDGPDRLEKPVTMDQPFVERLNVPGSRGHFFSSLITSNKLHSTLSAPIRFWTGARRRSNEAPRGCTHSGNRNVENAAPATRVFYRSRNSFGNPIHLLCGWIRIDGRRNLPSLALLIRLELGEWTQDALADRSRVFHNCGNVPFNFCRIQKLIQMAFALVKFGNALRLQFFRVYRWPAFG